MDISNGSLNEPVNDINQAQEIQPKKPFNSRSKKTALTLRKVIVVTVIVSFLISSITGFVFGVVSGTFASKSNLGQFLNQLPTVGGPVETVKTVNQDSAVIDAVKKVSPSVVSIIITQDLPKINRFNNPFANDPFFNQFFGQDFSIPQNSQQGSQSQVIGGGTGFVVSADGLILTNKHVVDNTQAEYTVLTNEGVKIPAKILARASNTDLAIIKIDPVQFWKDKGANKPLPVVELGDSSSIEIGQTVIAIGNALGEFRNTVSVGVVSGLSRSITASGGLGSSSEQLSNIIQTDAALNPGNSGGPLLNIEGQVIGVNVAIAESAQNISFTLPINDAKKIITDVQTQGRIIQPYIGVRYVLVTSELAQQNNLSVDHGALITRGQRPQDLAVIPSSPADKAGLVENDIILEVDGVEVDENNSLADIIGKHNVGDTLTMKVLHRGSEETIKVTLEERKS